MPGGKNYKKPVKKKPVVKKPTASSKPSVAKSKTVAKAKSVSKASTAKKPVAKKKPPTKPVLVTQKGKGFRDDKKVPNPKRIKSKSDYQSSRESDKQYFAARNVGFIPRDKGEEIAIAFRGDHSHLKDNEVNQKLRNKEAAKKKAVAKTVAKKKAVAKASTAKRPTTSKSTAAKKAMVRKKK